MSDLVQKQVALSDLLRELGRVVVAYSGGVDSAFLASVAHGVLGRDSLAVTAVSPSLARRELEQAKDLAQKRGWNHRLIGTHEVAREEYARNDADRCYWCKSELFETLRPLAHELGANILVGTNTDDLGDHRPGLKAADENGVSAPMVAVGLSKQEIRELSRRAGLPTAEKPASPCLASRFAYGVRVTPEGLRRVEAAEEFVRGFGFEVLRVRDHGDLARIEVAADEVPRAAALSEKLTSGLKQLGYRYVTLDMQGFRSGALNEVLPLPTIGSGPR
ncbi:MAG: ATP-dependent sacrificial sulfur transferase LarE [Actinomycetota bacterium]